SFALIGTGRRFAVLKQVNSQKYLKHSGETPVATNDAGASDRGGPVAGRMGGVDYSVRAAVVRRAAWRRRGSCSAWLGAARAACPYRRAAISASPARSCRYAAAAS